MLIINNEILFIEIPRTGTSTVRGIIKMDMPVNLKRHITLSDYLDAVPEHAGYKRVSFVRNPFDRIASLYEHTKAFNPSNENIETFEKFVDWLMAGVYNDMTYDDVTKDAVEMLTYNGGISVDFIGRFENYENDLKELISKFNVEQRTNITVNNKYKNKDYQSYYNERTKSIIGERYKDVLEYFDYNF